MSFRRLTDETDILVDVTKLSLVDLTKFACESLEFLKTALCHLKWSEKLFKNSQKKAEI